MISQYYSSMGILYGGIVTSIIHGTYNVIQYSEKCL
jgi:hypothetical protein